MYDGSARILVDFERRSSHVTPRRPQWRAPCTTVGHGQRRSRRYPFPNVRTASAAIVVPVPVEAHARFFNNREKRFATPSDCPDKLVEFRAGSDLEEKNEVLLRRRRRFRRGSRNCWFCYFLFLFVFRSFLPQSHHHHHHHRRRYDDWRRDHVSADHTVVPGELGQPDPRAAVRQSVRATRLFGRHSCQVHDEFPAGTREQSKFSTSSMVERISVSSQALYSDVERVTHRPTF